MGVPTRKMVNLSIEETSGVDHPAHLHEGWLVMKAASSDAVAKATEEIFMDMKDGANADDKKPSYEDLFAALEKANARIMEMEKMMDKPETDMEEKEEDLMKSASDPVRKAYEDMQKAVEDAQAKTDAVNDELRKERSERADTEAIVKARGAYANLGLNPDEVGPALRRLAETDSDLAKSIEDVLASADAKVESADIFSEIGKSASYPSGSSFQKAEAMAKAAVASGKSATYEQALSDVFISDSELYASYVNEQGA